MNYAPVHGRIHGDREPFVTRLRRARGTPSIASYRDFRDRRETFPALRVTVILIEYVALSRKSRAGVTLTLSSFPMARK